MASKGFLTEEQRETLKIASQNAEVMSSLSLSTSPKSPGPKSPAQNAVAEHNHHARAPTGGAGGFAGRPMRRAHSGKHFRAKKGKEFEKCITSGVLCCGALYISLFSSSI